MTRETAEQLEKVAVALGVHAEVKGPAGRMTGGAGGFALRVKGPVLGKVLEGDSQELEFGSFWPAKLFLQGALNVLKPAGGRTDLEEPALVG